MKKTRIEFDIFLRIICFIGISLIGLMTIVGSNGGGSGGSSDNTDIPGCLSEKDYTSTSYDLQKTCLYIDRHGIREPGLEGFALAVAYADFNGDGYEDAFISPGDGSENASPVEMYLNDGFDTTFTLYNNIFEGAVPTSIHPRKALTGDFNGDGIPDIFVIGHGHDQPPFPGEHPVLILSTPTGLQSTTGLESYVGFQHGGASADIDADNDLDIFVVDTAQPFFLINDGAGNFTYDTDKVPGDIVRNTYTAELIDIDSDGYYDLLIAGDELDGMPTTIYWGSDTYAYTASNKTVLPEILSKGTVLDIDAEDIDGDDVKDIVLNRTGSEPGNVYMEYYIQILINRTGRTFVDETNARIQTGTGDGWVDWVRLQDFDNDGTIDIIVDDADRGLIWLNDGDGYFEL